MHYSKLYDLKKLIDERGTTKWKGDTAVAVISRRYSAIILAIY